MVKDTQIFWIGGSPCCGKSTIAEMLVKEFGFDYYKCDDHLDRYMEIGDKNHSKIMKKFKDMNLDQTWLDRSIGEQIDDEVEFFRESLEIITKDVEENYKGKKVIVEGAAILPEFIINKAINKNDYICIVPTKEFQIEKYSKREWAQHYLEGCSDPEKAFYNWMERDAGYAEIVKNFALSNNMNVIIVDGSIPIQENYTKVKQLFRL